MSGEDFGYLKDEEQNKFSLIVKRALVFGTILFSISCFVYITINAYYFVYNDRNSDIPVIKSPDFPIKIVEEQNEIGKTKSRDSDKSVYENIVGNKKEKLENNSIKTIKPSKPLEVEKLAKVTERATDNGSNKVVGDGKIIVYSDAKSGLTNQDKSLNNVNSKNSPLSGYAKKSLVNKSGPGRVQLAALKNRATVEEYWKKLSNQNKKLFSGLHYFVEEADLGSKGRFYRLQVGNFRSQNEAEDFCARFISESGKTKSDCIVVE